MMGTGFWRRLEQREANKIFDAFVEMGGNCFDTALHYGDNEIFFGNWMKARNNRKEIVIHAKGAHHKIIHSRGTQFEYHCPRVNPDEIKRDIDETLRRLQTDFIDVFALHRDDADHPVGPIVECLGAEQKAGRIRASGTSNWNIARIEEANACAIAHGLPGFVSNSPNLALGFFSGQYRPIEQLSDKEFRKLMSDRWTANVVRVYYSRRNFERLWRVQRLAEELGVTPTQLALAWVPHQGDHVLAIAGPCTVKETKELFKAFEINLTADRLSWRNLEERVVNHAT